VFTTSTKADFRIDTTATKGIFSFVNLSDTALSDVYTWWVLAPDGSLKSPLKDTNRKIWENPKVFYRADKPNIDLLNLDFADDIGTFTICLKASTTDPTCPDSICKTIYNK
jgi:hypothetical protein